MQMSSHAEWTLAEWRLIPTKNYETRDSVHFKALPSIRRTTKAETWYFLVESEDITEMLLTILVFWDVTLCRLIVSDV
jgi:hypothetical protein